MKPLAPLLVLLLLMGMADIVSGRPAQSQSTVLADGPCAGFAQQIRLPGGLIGCSHGPDPVPAGVEIVRAPTIAELRVRAEAAASPMEGGQVSGGAAAAGSVPCIGDGVSGRRVEAIYAYEETAVSAYAEVAPMIRAWAGAADAVFDASAAKTGGSRHLRWLHDASCQPVVHEAAITSAAIGNIESMADELYTQGFTRSDRRYVVWVDTPSLAICGVAMNTVDDRPGQENILNGNPEAGFGLFARIDRQCWGLSAPQLSVEAHEISHTLGSVQPSAPNSSSTAAFFFGHCIDEWDTMCYADGSPKALVYRCPADQERVFDCQNNDYFSTNPPPGSYLATHWNTANSSFLVRVDPVAGFLDLAGSPFGGDIAWLANSGVTRGCKANQESFCPKGTVTREQMAAFLSRALALPATAGDYFADDGASLFEADINRLAASGITRGCTATSFCPDATITRGQMAAFLSRALSLATTSNDYFTDDETSIFEGEINRLAAAGITGGCTATTFCPAVLVTREQMAAFLRRALQ